MERRNTNMGVILAILSAVVSGIVTALALMVLGMLGLFPVCIMYYKSQEGGDKDDD